MTFHRENTTTYWQEAFFSIYLAPYIPISFLECVAMRILISIVFEVYCGFKQTTF